MHVSMVREHTEVHFKSPFLPSSRYTEQLRGDSAGILILYTYHYIFLSLSLSLSLPLSLSLSLPIN
jgi:hypothetical protein